MYFGDNNVDAMFAILSPLHEMIEAGATTLQEVQFAQAFGADLAEAWVTKTTMEIFFFFFRLTRSIRNGASVTSRQSVKET